MKKVLLISIFSLLSFTGLAQKGNIDSLIEKKQQLNLGYISLYKENSEMSYTSPGGEIGAPSGYVINGKLTTSYMLFAPRSLPIAFSFNPDFTARVRTDKSAGVRTPSFRLTGTFYVRLNDDIKRYKYAQLSFTHHSNGQDGDAILTDGSINTKTGNFNTNYLTAAYRFGYFTSAKSATGIYYSYNHKVGLEWHKWFNFEPALIGDYGFTRLNYDFSYRIYQIYHGQRGGWKKISQTNATGKNTLEKETWRFNGQFSYAVNKYANQDFFTPKRRLNVEGSANYSLPFMQNVFVMASFGYYGEDPYNIYFKDKYAFMRFGISSTFSRYKVREH
ncbi:hypothetical protein EZ428_21960 [Pedobacter frigiditerrae]|uniref:DUF4421 domain-containing protein n=1 Tax=Pedobacter frigiditerrae TaxID=2530452 RepID=A0A4R0ML12_9SPHI|nr:hypothetical protein [Pedobacter frigiditerrae]TCC87365.1 hypothetical protein EZ428_21960 [Pedobacter frigiditerrae]